MSLLWASSATHSSVPSRYTCALSDCEKREQRSGRMMSAQDDRVRPWALWGAHSMALSGVSRAVLLSGRGFRGLCMGVWDTYGLIGLGSISVVSETVREGLKEQASLTMQPLNLVSRKGCSCPQLLGGAGDHCPTPCPVGCIRSRMWGCWLLRDVPSL